MHLACFSNVTCTVHNHGYFLWVWMVGGGGGGGGGLVFTIH